MRTADGPKTCSGVYHKEGGKVETMKICDAIAEKELKEEQC
jgi:hypothetical protein